MNSYYYLLRCFIGLGRLNRVLHLGGRLEIMHRVMIAFLVIETLLMLVDSIVDLGVHSVVLDCAYYCWLLLVSP